MTRSLIVEADGGSRGNPGPAAFGAVVRDGTTGTVLTEIAGYLGHATNNVAEYRGTIAGLQQARALDPAAAVEVRLDSKLVVEQMAGRWKIKHPQIRELALEARDVMPHGQVTYTWVPREHNKHADALVNEMLDLALASGEEEILRRTGRMADDVDREDIVGAAEELSIHAAHHEHHPSNQLIGWADLGSPTMTLLARHGATQYSLEKRFSGRGGRDVPLAPLGERQAQALAAELAARGGADVIVASPLRRTQQTAAIVAQQVKAPVVLEADFAECSFGEWDGLTFAEVQHRWPSQVDEWLASTQVAPPGGESFADVRERVMRGRRRVVEDYPGQRVVVISHVTPIKVLVSLAIDAPLRSLFRMELAPCSITTLAWFPDGNASMFGFSDAAHLRAEMSPDGT